MRILLRSHLGSYTGFGKDGLGIMKGLLARGHDVDLEPYQVVPPISTEAAQALVFPALNSGYDLELHHGPPSMAGLSADSPNRARTKVLWTLWEYYTFPVSPGSMQLQNHIKNLRIKEYDSVVSYTQQTEDALREAEYVTEDQKLRVVQGGFDPDPWSMLSEVPEDTPDLLPDRARSMDGPFRFAMVGHLSPRKNVPSVVTAFSQLLEEKGKDFDAELLLKTTAPAPHHPPHIRNIRERQWTDEQMKQFYWSIDCLVNMSEGEAKNLPALEATACGTPILVNDLPGHRGWNHPGIQKLVPTTKIDWFVYEASGRYTEIQDIKDAMWEMYQNRFDVNHRRAKQLASYVTKTATWNARLAKLGEELDLPI